MQQRNAILSFLILIAVIPPSAFGQKATLGVVTGANLTDHFQPTVLGSPGLFSPVSTAFFTDASQRFIVGPRFELSLPKRLSVEFEALHREIRSTSRITFSPPFVTPDGIEISSIGPRTSTEFTWEFSLLGKYRLSASGVKPFVELGSSFLPIENSDQTGITAGSGIELHYG